jgi:hypothetical protein
MLETCSSVDSPPFRWIPILCFEYEMYIWCRSSPLQSMWSKLDGLPSSLHFRSVQSITALEYLTNLEFVNSRRETTPPCQRVSVPPERRTLGGQTAGCHGTCCLRGERMMNNLEIAIKRKVSTLIGGRDGSVQCAHPYVRELIDHRRRGSFCCDMRCQSQGDARVYVFGVWTRANWA